MITRRLLLVATAVLLAPTFGRAASAADLDRAANFVNQLLTDLLAVANGDTPQGSKAPALSRIVEERVDIAGVARFCLGRFWRMATPEQQKDYVALFHRVLINNVTGKVGEYKGVSFTLGKPVARDDDIAVATLVMRPGQAPNKVDWVVSTGGAPKVIDVIAEGTSLRLTQRSDYAAYLTRNGNNVQALIDALKQQASGA